MEIIELTREHSFDKIVLYVLRRINMSDDRLARLEDMMGQLIGMVGKVLGEQQEMRADMSAMKMDISSMKVDISSMKVEISTIDARLERVENSQINYNDPISYLLDKTAEHDKDIHAIKGRLLKI
jgi:predicted  nucleic acid-binding Zn-ribbon protein